MSRFLVSHLQEGLLLHMTWIQQQKLWLLHGGGLHLAANDGIVKSQLGPKLPVTLQGVSSQIPSRWWRGGTLQLLVYVGEHWVFLLGLRKFLLYGGVQGNQCDGFPWEGSACWLVSPGV